MKRYALLILLLSATAAADTPPSVTHLYVQQRANSQLVDITFSVVDPDDDPLTVSLYLLDGAGMMIMPCSSVGGAVGDGIMPGSNLHIVWNAGADYPGQYGADYTLRVVADDGHAPAGFVLIPAGTFTMGSPTEELGRNTDEVQHQVTLTRPFWLATTEVTEQLWDSVMGSGTSTSQLPKAYVSWYQAVAFCNALSLHDGLTPAYSGSGTSWTWNQSANGYRLPTEAEWEYACRAGSTTAFANGGITETGCDHDPNLAAMGWYCGNSGGYPHPVGQKAGNAWGLSDMHGNVWEWCWDWYGSYPTSAVTDPVGPSSGVYRITRGGQFANEVRYCRSAYRGWTNHHLSLPGVGFRLSRGPSLSLENPPSPWIIGKTRHP